MLMDIKCLSKDPLFYVDPTPNDPLFSTSVSNFYIILHKNCNFFALHAHFQNFKDFVAILTENLQTLCIFAHWMTPIFGSPHQKSPHFFGAHTEWPPFFDEILHRTPPIFFLREALVSHFHIWEPPPGPLFIVEMQIAGPVQYSCMYIFIILQGSQNAYDFLYKPVKINVCICLLCL